MMDKGQENLRRLIINIAEHKELADHMPVQLHFGLTNICNLNCPFCPYNGFCKKAIESPQNIDISVLEELQPYFETALFINPSLRGEPLLYKNFKEFLEILRKVNALSKLQLINNGTLLSNYSSKIFSDINIISFSIDAADAKTFNILRYKADYETVILNIKKLREELPNNILQFTVTVNRLNSRKLIPIYLLARELKINYLTFNQIYGEESDGVIQLLRLRRSDYKVIFDQIDEIIRLNNDKEIIVMNVMEEDNFEDDAAYNYEEIYEELLALRSIEPELSYDRCTEADIESHRVKKENKKNIHNNSIYLPYCTSPFTSLCIWPDQNVNPCCVVRGTGAIQKLTADKNISEVWNSKEFCELREAMFDYDMLPDYCRECKSFCRYDYINEYVDYLKNTGVWDYNNLVIPPNYTPATGTFTDKLLESIIEKHQYGFSSIACNKNINLEEEQIMNKEIINSKLYWDGRFSSDWKKYSGNEQTEFFAKISCGLIPDWLVHTIKTNNYVVCDFGCACGEAVNILAQRLGFLIEGADFSAEALKIAKENYPIYNFVQADANNLPEDFRYNVIYSSNVLEHFLNPWDIALKLSYAATDYLVFQIPYRETLNINEHMYKFDSDQIPLRIGSFELVFVNAVDCKEIPETLYPDFQVLLVYSSHEEDRNAASLAHLSEGIQNIERIQLNKIISDLTAKTETLQNECQEMEEKNIKQAVITEKLTKLSEEKVSEIKNISAELESKKQIIQLLNQKQEELDKQLSEVTHNFDNLNKQIIDDLPLKQRLKTNEILLQEAENQIVLLSETKAFQFIHLLFRIKYQFLKGDKKERKKFRTWLWAKLKHNPGDCDHQYNPLFRVKDILDKRHLPNCIPVINSQSTNLPFCPLSDYQRELLERPYTKYDVIIMSVIDYDFRYQRPQHFAARFADNGHRVFYVNANFKNDFSVKERSSNLYIVNLRNDCGEPSIYNADWTDKIKWLSASLSSLMNDYCIRDAVVVVDYPNWLPGALFLRKEYGVKIITDYMDDFTGFLDMTDATVKDYCIDLLQNSDYVVASSQFLYDIACKYNEHTVIIRNGTEFEHFHQAAKEKKHMRKVIGYYGAVAHWFDLDKVCYVAKNLPDCDVVIIGDVTNGREELEKYDNIKLLGEISYCDLPKHLSYFDVCLIPFDTSTDLIKATNPVKFYEYLSAGKKVVATEIPELKPFKDHFVYMSNNNDEFLEYIKLCLTGTDDLADLDECIDFGRSNDWQKRYQTFSDICSDVFPKVSIIVLTYNNLELNKICINSILQKTAYPNYELIIVDNMSSDGTIEYLRELQRENRSNVKIIFNDKNCGFAGGNNIGIQCMQADYYILLNNDTIVTRGWVTSLVKHMINTPTLGMCGPVTNSIGNEAKIVCEYTSLQGLDKFSYFYTTNNINKEYLDPKSLALFCTIIRSEIIENCGLLDENYRVGMFEDDDYSEAVKAAGYKLAIAEDAFIHHFDGSSFKKLLDENYKKIFEANKAVFEKKWSTHWVMHSYRKGVDCDSPTGKIAIK